MTTPDVVSDQEDRTELLDRLNEEDWDGLRDAFRDSHPADIAECLHDADRDDLPRIFALITQDARGDVLGELREKTGSEIIESLTDKALADIVGDMPPDDAADLIRDLPEERSEHILDLTKDEQATEVRKLLRYHAGTAGGIMTPDVIAMNGNQTVAEALQAIAYMDVDEQFVYAYIVDHTNCLIGYAGVWQLLRTRNRQRALRDIAQTDVAAAHVDMDQEEVAQLMKKYDVGVLPVVDKDGCLLGRITGDDVIDVMAEEASEDIFRLAGSDDAELDTTSPLETSIVRLPWLMITLAGGAITSIVLRNFVSRLSDFIILTAFVPIVLAMGGNTGIQASVLSVRRIALGSMQGRRLSKLLLRETAAGALMGLVCGTIIGIWAHVLIGRTPTSVLAAGPPPIYLAAVVALALFCAMTFAAVFGAFVPLVLDRLHIDPAVAAGPFVTITNDISALLIYFGTTLLLLRGYGVS